MINCNYFVKINLIKYSKRKNTLPSVIIMHKIQEKICFLCGSKENVVVTFPQVKETFKKWIEILNITEPIEPSDKKQLCVLHFDKKWENILLQGNARRCAYIFPTPVLQISGNSNKRSISPSLLLPTSSTLYNTNKKPANYELMYKIKQDEVKELTDKIKTLEIENMSLKKAAANNNNFESVITELPENASNLIKVLVSKKCHGRRYSKQEKMLCQTLYYKDPGYYKFLRDSLDGLLPTKVTMLRWQPIKTLKIGVVPEIFAYLKDVGNTLTEHDRNVVITLDEMDGRQGLQYDSNRDCVIGFEYLISASRYLAKKFLTVMIRGLNGLLGNIIIANFATKNGVDGD